MHEAGHAVYAMYVSAPVVSIDLNEINNFEYAYSMVDANKFSKENFVMYSVAGVVAQRVKWIGGIDATMFIVNVSHISNILCAEDYSTLFLEYKKKVRRVLKGLRPAIVALADALVIAGSLRRRDIEKIAFKACPELKLKAQPRRPGLVEAAFNLASFVTKHKITSLPSTACSGN